MTRSRVKLERFDLVDPDPPLEADSATIGLPVAAEPEPEPEPELLPAAPEPEPTVETLARIQALLEACLRDSTRARREAEAAAAELLGKAAQHVLPNLAKRGFSDEIAAAARAVMTALAPQSIVLEVAPEAFEQVSAALGGGLDPQVVVQPSTRLEPGQAEISWADGGADLDVGWLTEEALRLLEERLAT